MAKKRRKTAYFTKVHEQAIIDFNNSTDLEEREKWIRWGKNNNVEIFSWPRLPKTIFANRSDSYKRWERLICFPLTSTKEIKL